MEELEKLNNQLYGAQYGIPKVGNYQKIWNSIRGNKEVLQEAIQIKRNKWNNGDILKAGAIGEAILMDFKNVDPEIYYQLVNTIYTNSDIAGISFSEQDGGHFARHSFLLITLWKPDLKLTEEQKAFAVTEATTNHDHGIGSFDIRYWILRNPNWTLEEKQKLAFDFWDDAEDYDERLDSWEWAVVNDSKNYKGKTFPPFDRYELFYEWNYEMLLIFYGDSNIADGIWKEMEFCKKMHELRPQQWEISKKLRIRI